MRDLLFLFVLLIAAASVVTGVALWSVPTAFILAGVLLALIGWQALSDDPVSVDALEVDE